MTAAEVAELLGMDAALRERVFWSMLYESAARAEEILNLDIEDGRGPGGADRRCTSWFRPCRCRRS